MPQTVHLPTDLPTDLTNTARPPELRRNAPSLTANLWPALVEIALLLVAAPLLYFPDRVQSQLGKVCGCEAAWIIPVGLVLLALLWPLRRVLTGRWAAPMPVAGAIWFWFLIMLPVAIWAAPIPLREQYSWPRAYILVWNFSLFWCVLSHASHSRHKLGWAIVGWIGAIQAIAMVAPFGMEARTKLPVIGQLQDLIPRPLLSVFSGAEAGFSTNQVAGVLLFVLPLLIVFCVAGLRQRGWLWWVVLLCTAWMGATLLLTQSRGGLLSMALGLVALLLMTRRWGWIILGVAAAAISGFLFFLPPAILDAISDAPGMNAVGGVVTIKGFRLLVWAAGNAALSDFPLTGMGLGTFRELVYMLYPLPGILPSYDLAHAHNFFLQTGLDFGVPGLLAILAVYVAAIVQLVQLAHLPTQRAIWPTLPFLTPRVLAIGWMGCLVAQTFYSLFDAVAMGSKPNFVWWWWLALIFAAANYLLRTNGAAESTT